MSVSATTAAKRRRAGNIVSSQLFKPTSAPIENSIQRRTATQQNVQQPVQSTPLPTSTIQNQQPINLQQSNNQKPMSLQQVISVFDKRLLHIESIIAKEQQLISGNAIPVEQPSINNEQVQEMIQHYLSPHISEFDHRYQLLATEISNLKQIVLKLQAYTLDVNKSLIEERIQILSDMKANVVIQPEDTLQLKEDIKDLEESVQEEKTSEENQENITFTINTNNDIKEELIQETSSKQIIEENVQENSEEVAIETIETKEDNQENSEEVAIETVETEEDNQENSEDVILETVETEEDNQENSEDVILETVETEEDNHENSEDVILETVEHDQETDKIVHEELEQLMQSTEDNENQNTKEILRDDLTKISESITQVAEEKVEEPIKSKRKRKNKKSVAVNI
jgi:hypothetical protein